jgi:Transposase, Mutator family
VAKYEMYRFWCRLVNEEGFREVLAVTEGSKEDEASWAAFLRHLKERGLKGINEDRSEAMVSDPRPSMGISWEGYL